MTARGGPQLPWQRFEAAAALVKHLRQRQTDQLTANNDPAGSVAMDGRLTLVFAALTTG